MLLSFVAGIINVGTLIESVSLVKSLKYNGPY